jgi:hypothetical protein
MDPNQIQPGTVSADASSSVVPVSASPLMGSVQPATVNAGSQPVSEEQRQELLDMINQIQTKLGSFNAIQFASKNSIEKIRRDLLKQVFQKLQLSGVDLTDQQSVADFIGKIKSRSPELATMFENAMGVLLGDGSDGYGTPKDPTESINLGIPLQNNMNIQNQNETISKG